MSIEHDFDGVRNKQGIGGATLSNVNFIGPPKWGPDREAWQLGDTPYYYNGRRRWKLNWSHVKDSEMEPYNYYGNVYSSETATGSNVSITGGATNWFQDCVVMTQGGSLPFLFAPDPNMEYYWDGDTTVGPRGQEMAVCRFDMNSFKRTQTSFKTYDMSVDIYEAW